MLTLTTELARIRGINKRLLAGLKKLSLITVQDLLNHFPFRYDDFSRIANIQDVEANQTVTIRGRIQKISARRAWRRNLTLVEALIADETGGIRAIWFNQPYLIETIPAGTIGNFAGKTTLSKGILCLSNPAYEPLSGAETKHTAGLVPIYPETRGITSRGMRYLIKPILNTLRPIPECIPHDILRTAGLPGGMDAIRAIHFPRSLEEAEQARRRIAFEDLFLLQLANLRTKMRLARESAPAIRPAPAELDAIIASLPFTLTASQRHSLNDIMKDLAKPHPMNRLLQGDVGSGKTVVIAIAAILAAKYGSQTAILAPTEVLARQHYRTLIKLFGSIMDKWKISLCLVTAAESRSFYGDGLETACPKQRIHAGIGEGILHIAIGTHALIQKNMSFPSLALIIVDEQHRFGVEQRAALAKSHEKEKNCPAIPHFLSMSATPIPRTLSLTVFGDLDLSIIDELPSGRREIITKIVSPAHRPNAYQFIKGQIAAGRQAFVICPRITTAGNEGESRPDDLAETKGGWSEVKAVTEEYEKLSREVFPDVAIGMLHGKLKNADKARIMQEFRDNKIHILVATSVIEVGVDIPNATIMAIEDADRFGLAQLYQFRGRVGRGAHQSVCLLFTNNDSKAANQRLASLLEAKNGFELAEKDLAIRGPGEFLGQSQTGMPDLAMKALNNMELVKTARDAALQTLSLDPDLLRNPLLNERLSQFKKAVHLE